MKKLYTSPEIEKICVSEDIITTSGPIGEYDVNDPLYLPEIDW